MFSDFFELVTVLESRHQGVLYVDTWLWSHFLFFCDSCEFTNSNIEKYIPQQLSSPRVLWGEASKNSMTAMMVMVSAIDYSGYFLFVTGHSGNHGYNDGCFPSPPTILAGLFVEGGWETVVHFPILYMYPSKKLKNTLKSKCAIFLHFIIWYSLQGVGNLGE